MKKSGIVLLTFFAFFNSFAQNQLFKGYNLLIPSNLVVNYTVRLDTCYRFVNDKCIEQSSKAFLKNKSDNDLLGIIVDSVMLGNVNCYKTDSWLTYQILENSKKTNANEIEKKLNNSGFNTFDKEQLVGLNFVEEWEVTSSPMSFQKHVIGYMPLMRYYSDEDSSHENPLYQTPFTIIDTLIKKKPLKQSAKRMLLTNEIEYEYFFYLDYSYPYDIDDLTKTYKKFGHSVDNYILSKETSEYLSRTGILNFLKIMTDKVILGELMAYDYYENEQISVSELKERMGAIKDTTENDEITRPFNVIYTLPMDFDVIQSIVFLEKWYIDPVTLRMQKKVVGIAPVKHYYTDDDEYEERLKREILFKVYFDEKMN